MYELLRPLLFALEPERAHDVALRGARQAERLGLARIIFPPPLQAPLRCMGLAFPNPVGLAAGLDKNGAFIDALAAFGFGFIEIGTVTPRAQPGSAKPRLFRLPHAHALINRLGFNNDGVDALIENVRRARYRGVLGINIGKNFATPIERAADDYALCLQKVYAHASYVTVNISSPNSAQLRALQQAKELAALLTVLKAERKRLAAHHGRQVPLVVKIAPDLDDAEVCAIGETLMKHEVDAVIATNTTLARSGVNALRNSGEAGGLSGAPLAARATHVVRVLGDYTGGALPLIGVGGIMRAPDAQAKFAAGASLVQLYTGLIYRGPALVREICAALAHESIGGDRHAYRRAEGS